VADENLSTDEKVQRSVARTLGNGLLALALLALLGGWASLGAFTLAPGQAAVLLLFGDHLDTLTQEGFHLVLPPPIVTREIVNVAEVRNEDFGLAGRKKGEPVDPKRVHEATMQTSDNNIVLVSFAVQYRIKDAYAARFQIAEPVSVVRDAAQAAMRQVVGGMTVDGVLRERRAELTADASSLLQDILVELADVQPPDAVRAAFDDVVAATQDASRAVNEAEGYRNEVLPDARAQAAELGEQAKGYREAKIAEATGQAQRFRSLVAEYEKAPDVTRKRLYLETMEKVLPSVEKVIVEPGTASVLPYLPLGRAGGPAAGGGAGATSGPSAVPADGKGATR
jgi:membrane protease subunit HflK